MGIIERRNSGLDKVSDLDADSFVELFNTAYAHSNEKLDTLVDTQKRIVDQIKDNESQCEKASTAMYLDASAFKSQCAELKQLANFSDDVREAKQAVEIIVEALQKLNALLPEQLQMEPFCFSKVTSDSGAVTKVEKAELVNDAGNGSNDAALVYGAALDAKVLVGKKKRKKKRTRNVKIID